MSTSPDTSSAPRPAATVMFVRDAAAGGLQVCLLRRNEQSGFVGGAWLFPGGAVDPADADPAMLARCDGLAAEEAARRLRVEGDRDAGRAFWVAAVREAFEECALLPAEAEAGRAPLSFDDPAVAARFARHRAALDAGSVTLAQVLAAERLRVDLSALHYVAHWVTPVGAPRRYDTRFFVARAPHGQTLAADGTEVVVAEWVSPAQTLARLEAGEIAMLPPTRESLRWLSGFPSADAVLDAAASLEAVPRYEPRFVTQLDGSTRIVLDDPSDGEEPRSWQQ